MMIATEQCVATLLQDLIIQAYPERLMKLTIDVIAPSLIARLVHSDFGAEA